MSHGAISYDLNGLDTCDLGLSMDCRLFAMLYAFIPMSQVPMSYEL